MSLDTTQRLTGGTRFGNGQSQPQASRIEDQGRERGADSHQPSWNQKHINPRLRESSFTAQTPAYPVVNLDDDGDSFPNNVLHHYNLEDEPPNGQRLASVLKMARIFRNYLLADYLNLLLLLTPIAIVAGRLHWNPKLVFALNFLAIIPYASVINFSTDELSATLGVSFGGLINGIFGRPVELIVSIVALVKGEVRLVQSIMIGSILFNILFVLGSAFLVGGVKYMEQAFNRTVASTHSSFLTVASASLIVPTVFSITTAGTADDPNHAHNIAVISHGTAVVLLTLYLVYLLFQLKTHSDLFDHDQEEGEGFEAGQSHGPVVSSVAIILSPAVVAVCAVLLIDSAKSIAQTSRPSLNFLGIVPIAIVGNIAEYPITCSAGWRNRMDIAISLAIGNSMQIALFVTPFLVLLGWVLGQPLTFNFSDFEAIAFFVSVFVVVYLVQDGKSNYLEGLMCIALYAIIALAIYLLPADKNGVEVLATFLFSRR